MKYKTIIIIIITFISFIINTNAEVCSDNPTDNIYINLTMTATADGYTYHWPVCSDCSLQYDLLKNDYTSPAGYKDPNGTSPGIYGPFYHSVVDSSYMVIYDPEFGNWVSTTMRRTAEFTYKIFYDTSNNKVNVSIYNSSVYWSRVISTTRSSSHYSILLQGGDIGSVNSTLRVYSGSTCPQETSANFTITTYDNFTASQIYNFSVVINGTYYYPNITTGIVTTPMLQNSTQLYNITVLADNYYNKSYLDQNISSNLEASIYQAILKIQVKDIVNTDPINSYTINITLNTTSSEKTTSNSFVNYTVKAGNYHLKINSSGYDEFETNITITALQTNNIIINMSPLVNITLLKESDGSTFFVNETDETKITIYCSSGPNSTLQYTLANNTLRKYISCPWSLLRVDVDYNSTTYYRTLIPSLDERDITFYVVDLSEDLVYQVILVLNDLTGEFVGSTGIIKKSIAGSTVEVIEQDFDVENKIVAYLLKDGLYTLSVRTNTTEKSVGEFIVDSAGEKTITIPTIEYVPEAYLGDLISWAWGDDNNTRIVLDYSDTSSYLTENITLTVYNGSNTSSILYTTTSYIVSNITFNYLIQENSSYFACFRSYNSQVGYFDDCITVTNLPSNIGDMDGYDDEDEENFKTWLSILFLVALVGIFNKRTEIGLALVCFFMFVLMKWEWLDLGSPTINYTILSLSVIITVIVFFIQGDKK